MVKVIIGAIVVVLIGAGGFLYYQSSQKKLANPPTETDVTVDEQPSPTPTPEEVAKDEYSIEIQNGSGIAGEAGRAQSLLEGSNFVVDLAGNADNYDYEETVIQAKEGVSDAWVDQLKEALKEKYSVKPRVETLDDADSDSDVVVIVGQNDAGGTSMVVEEVVDETETPIPTTGVTETKIPTPSPIVSQ
ncbi:hypothetical protein CO051_06690 [Candidatus Roizmanbacteria bacterium CG_4_9_14_0_2_um_filter_39_13]|uniref:LytR/CpsA/Psr regulator C-terminal domain-containing protein n=2 Tax=Candidatus Roizmaniibacteriota TaxID=1752723 RepID=A0A2M8EWL1_9BACT|nr:MAG: hypothetical protein COY15_01085 [Candidatus Roizmanbacteria bacterium CG_4_10_14_0_2_um_filter_39_12]PJC30255.1 MAG: hypothetical protein CO051_06690 [Candidatus Roizmanbacteria bacterium CG_4_9_14_0_2_um_filter_39_13]PJE62113.1 MAG: hypothetical protein COU87_00965 [Candidatus Roizmanbacteria bacterium CG10_big_fil_rev_8_21_14_0_10_39_12]